MNTRSILLGGAMAVALAGAGFAQTAGDATPTGKPAHHAMVHHYSHHMRHRLLHTASMHAPATAAERAETNNLNRDQLRPVQYAPRPQYGQAGAAAYPRAPGQDNGITPVRRIPNGNPYQSGVAAGGRADTPSLNQAHRL